MFAVFDTLRPASGPVCWFPRSFAGVRLACSKVQQCVRQRLVVLRLKLASSRRKLKLAPSVPEPELERPERENLRALNSR